MKTIDKFVDAHIHLWDLATGWYPSLEGEYRPELNEYGVGDHTSIMGKNFLLPDYLALAQNFNVTKLVHVTAATTKDLTDETRWLQSLADSQDIPIAIIGRTELTGPIDEIKAELKAHAESANFRGIRNQDVIDFTSEHTFAAFDVMQEMGLVYDTVAHDDSLLAAASLAKRFPGMQFVMEHTGWPNAADERTFAVWAEGMRTFAALPNTLCKVSGLGMVMHDWTLEDFRPWVATALDAFGPHRCMFATNFPVDSVFSTFDTLVGAFNELTQDYSEQERSAMFANNAERVYQI